MWKRILLSLLCFSCSANDASNLKHEFGQTSGPGEHQKNCVDGSTEPFLVSSIKDLAAYIIGANPATFSQYGEALPICVVLSPGASANASMGLGGLMTIERGLLKVVANEAELAAVVAHELAHLTMGHVMRTRDEPYRDDPRYLAAQEQAILAKQKMDDLFVEIALQLYELFIQLPPPPEEDASLKGLYEQISAMSREDIQRDGGHVLVFLFFEHTTGLSDEQRRIVVEKQERMREASLASVQAEQRVGAVADEIVGGGQGAHKNWMEEEADEVGLEFYLRAGFRAADYGNILSKLGSGQETQCHQLSAPSRGEGTHPNSCWRQWNTSIQELAEHRADYQPWIDANKRTARPDSNLDLPLD